LLIASFSLPFIFSAMIATSYATSATAAYCAAPSFSASASELLQACKGLEAFRKGAQSSFAFRSSGLDVDSVFFSTSGAGLTVEGFCWKEAFLAWLPSGDLSACGGFSLPWLPFFSFVKSAKGKGSISYESGRLCASASGASLSLEAKPSLFDSEAAERQGLMRQSYYLPEVAGKHLSDDAEGFPLLPFLTASAFASDDAAKLTLCGAGFSADAFFATDGFSLRKAPCRLPAFPKAGAFPSDAWLPAWLAPVVEAFAKSKEREDLLGFYFPVRQGAQALRFCAPSGLIVALRFSEAPGSFPACQGLIPDRLPFSFAIDRGAFLQAVESLQQALKSSAGSPLIDLSFDAEAGQLLLSALLQENKGTKAKPDLVEVGRQDASCHASFRKASEDPRFAPGFYEKPEAEREGLMGTFESSRRLCANAGFLQRALKSFAVEGDRILFQWRDERSAFLLSAFVPESLCLIMPVQKRR
jgi:hypothetical protein